MDNDFDLKRRIFEAPKAVFLGFRRGITARLSPKSLGIAFVVHQSLWRKYSKGLSGFGRYQYGLKLSVLKKNSSFASWAGVVGFDPMEWHTKGCHLKSSRTEKMNERG